MWFRRGSFSKFRGRDGLQHLGWCSCVFYLAVWWPDARAMARSSSGEPAPCLRTDPIQRAQICCLKKFTPPVLWLGAWRQADCPCPSPAPRERFVCLTLGPARRRLVVLWPLFDALWCLIKSSPSLWPLPWRVMRTSLYCGSHSTAKYVATAQLQNLCRGRHQGQGRLVRR